MVYLGGLQSITDLEILWNRNIHQAIFIGPLVGDQSMQPKVKACSRWFYHVFQFIQIRYTETPNSARTLGNMSGLIFFFQN